MQKSFNFLKNLLSKKRKIFIEIYKFQGFLEETFPNPAIETNWVSGTDIKTQLINFMEHQRNSFE